MYQSVPTTCGSKMLQNFVPPYDAHVVTRLREADAILIGKTNMDEFAMGSSTENSAYFTTRNPWDLTRIPGVLRAARRQQLPAARHRFPGHHTGGSIRQPASLCGIVGIKPTYGRISRYGLIAFASSLDQVGPFTHDVYDNALLMEILSGHDPRDSTSVDCPVPPYTKTLNAPVTPLTIGVPKEFFGEGLDAEVENVVKAALGEYEKLGRRSSKFRCPTALMPWQSIILWRPQKLSAIPARYDGMHYGYRTPNKTDLINTYSKSRGEGFGKEVQRRIMLGIYALSSGYRMPTTFKALKVRRLIKDDFDKAFADCDVVIGPTAPTAAFRMGEKTDNPWRCICPTSTRLAATWQALPGSAFPAASQNPDYRSACQILAAPFDEEKMLRVARMYEAVTQWHTIRPKLG